MSVWFYCVFLEKIAWNKLVMIKKYIDSSYLRVIYICDIK